ncbi:MAG TPA: family 20 glycosylhydrolase [Chitinophagaceae bacterium]|nr:family 20 glycosylhydrolase [Chitinophagaceae bacterium]
MQKISFFILTLIIQISVFTQERQLNLIPWPVEVKQDAGSYTLKNKMTVSNTSTAIGWEKIFPYLRDEMKKQFGITLIEAEKGKTGDIDFFLKRMPTSGKPAYTLDAGIGGIKINSNFDEPAFHAIQTLFQLINIEQSGKRTIPYVHIFDHARFNYRGMHLDVGRHFFPVSFIKKYIDYLAYHKLNTFHWHLTEDQGWRIEIKKYPELTKNGAWRNGTIIGRYPGAGNDNIRYGGFYTQEEIKEVVKYADERYIEVIPEIEMPGHSSAAIAAYPWLSCFPEKPTSIPSNMISKKSVNEQKNGRIKLVQETWGVFDDVFCAGSDSTFIFLQNVIDEVVELFPSKYFHIGGDECPKTHWKQCSRCQQRMKENNLKDEHELQSWFVQKIEKYLNSKRKTLIGWDEILEGGLAPNAVVMSWRGETGGIQAAKQKHKVIMTPGNPVYFDHSQSENEDSITIGGYNPIEKVYAYEPVPSALTAEQGEYVLGAQANVWTEYMKNTKKVEYMIFPRMAALSEVLWSTKENKDWNDFERRLITQFNRYKKWGVNYSKAYYDIKSSILPGDKDDHVLWKLESKQKNITIKYITHFAGRPYPSSFSEGMTYETPVKVNSTKLVAAIGMAGNKAISNPVYETFHFNKATGKKITLTTSPSKNYPGDGAFTLVNGVINEKGMGRSKEFLGFSGINCEAIIDLGESKEISFVTVNCLRQEASWIWQPQSAEVWGSSDGQNWYSLKLTDDFALKNDGSGKGTMTMAFRKTFCRYVKLQVTNWGQIPAGSPGGGNNAWLFVDEIEIN